MVVRKQAEKRRQRRGSKAPTTSAAPTPTLLYGRHAVVAALANPARQCRCLWATADVMQTLEPTLLQAAAERRPATREDLDALVADGSHQGLALDAAPLPARELGQVCRQVPGTKNLVLVLDQVTDPRNIGAIVRSAAAFGARAVVMTDRHAPAAVTGALAKTACGGIEHVALVRVVNLARALDQLADLGYWRLGLDATAPGSLEQAAVAGFDNLALVLGAEGSGLRRLTAGRCDLTAHIPLAGAAQVASLNVAVAAAIALYALVK